MIDLYVHQWVDERTEGGAIDGLQGHVVPSSAHRWSAFLLLSRTILASSSKAVFLSLMSSSSRLPASLSRARFLIVVSMESLYTSLACEVSKQTYKLLMTHTHRTHTIPLG